MPALTGRLVLIFRNNAINLEPKALFLTIAILYKEAYGVAIKEESESRLARDVSMGALHAALVRLEEEIKSSPPKVFLWFFRWYCHPRLKDHIEGDLTYANELFNTRITLNSFSNFTFLLFSLTLMLDLIIILGIVLLTGSMKAAMANPVKSPRSE